MHARVVTNQIQPGKTDEWMSLIRDAVVPSLREQTGFRGFVMLVDRGTDRTIGYSLWDTVDDMTASEASGNYRDQIAKLGSVLAAPPERAAYEIISLD